MAAWARARVPIGQLPASLPAGCSRHHPPISAELSRMGRSGLLRSAHRTTMGRDRRRERRPPRACEHLPLQILDPLPVSGRGAATAAIVNPPWHSVPRRVRADRVQDGRRELHDMGSPSDRVVSNTVPSARPRSSGRCHRREECRPVMATFGPGSVPGREPRRFLPMLGGRPGSPDLDGLGGLPRQQHATRHRGSAPVPNVE